MSLQALDPTLKTAYAQEKWQTQFYEAGLQRLREVVRWPCLSLVRYHTHTY